MESYEKEVQKKLSKDKDSVERLDIPTIKYFWLSSPLSSRRKQAIPNFLRNIHVLQNFSDYELRIFSRFLHERAFEKGETIFHEGDGGFGFYLVLSGHVEIIVKDPHASSEDEYSTLIQLERDDYFGELALLEENSKRSATARTLDSTVLLGIFKPDLEELIDCYPTVAAKLLQSISIYCC
jgi:CRP/FNR family cyclic AMP-dependent transcriptional regulator